MGCFNQLLPCPRPRSFTHGGVQVDEDGAWHVFAAAGLGEEGLEGARVGEVRRIGVGATICQETVLEQVPGLCASISCAGCSGVFEDAQLPGAVAQLDSRLSYVQVTDLTTKSADFNGCCDVAQGRSSRHRWDVWNWIGW
jgi:hypothetical protein